MQTLNLGILAHVDAGKTTLTERLLYNAGVIDALGSVDQGTTQTDSLALEQQRGITIKTAVASFAVDDVTVNLIDTPGHPDFIAEVERALRVLDGVVLVISAVEGVQPQTRILMRALQRMRVPTLLFVNKIDRRGAREMEALQEISERLTPAVVAMGTVRDLGTRAADFTRSDVADAGFVAQLADVLAQRDESIMAAYVSGDSGVSHGRLRDALTTQTKRALVHPVFFGSAITGAGIDALTAAVIELLPTASRHAEGPVAAGCSRSNAVPRGRRSRTYGCSRARSRPETRSSCLTTRSSASRPSACSDAVAQSTAEPLWPETSRRSGASPTAGSATRSANARA